jgi:hypothetical protein
MKGRGNCDMLIKYKMVHSNSEFNVGAMEKVQEEREGDLGKMIVVMVNITCQRG